MSFRQQLWVAAWTTVLSILPPAVEAAEGTDSGAAELLSCQFDDRWDQNYDGWPDNWRRRVDDDYPGYVRIEIEEDPNAASGRSLKVRLRGGSAYFHCPELPVSPLYSYVLKVRARTEMIEHAEVSTGIVWQAKDGTPVGETERVSLARSGQTQEVRVGPISPSSPEVETAVVFVQIERGKQIDLEGLVVVDELSLHRLPQVLLTAQEPLGLFGDPRDVAVRCRLTGIPVSNPTVRFELRSVEGELIEQAPIAVTVAPIAARAATGNPGEATARDYQGEAIWRPKQTDYGFYRIDATLLTGGAEGEKRTTSIAVLRPLPRPAQGIFGWSVGSIRSPHTTENWTKLLTQLGVHWLKFPVWYDSSESRLGDELVQFTERLAAFGIEVVGVVDRAPVVDDASTRLAEAGSIADIFTLDSSYWLPALDPIMTRLSLRIRWWQFGGDHDTSLVGYPDLPVLIENVRQQLYRFGQNVKVGIPWKWMADPPSREDLPWQFIQWSSEPSLTGGELGASLDGRASDAVGRWVLIEPLPRAAYSRSIRVADLIQQMMSARIKNADAAFLPQPVDAARGVLDDAGMPDELLLPFRTTAMLLADAQHAGSMRLPAGSHNHVFRKPDGSLLMVVWSDAPATEELFLGEGVLHLDPWGREIPAAGSAEHQAIRVSAVPSFVLGLHELATTVRISAQFEHPRMPSVFGRAHSNVLSFVNSSAQGIGGSVTPVGSGGWNFSPNPLHFKAAAGAVVRIPFELAPRSDASSGRQEVRLDFDIPGSEKCSFSVWKHFDIGLGDIEIEISTALQKDGTLVVEQRTLNHTDERVDFKCLLYAPGRRRQRNHIFRLGRGQDLQYYRFDRADDLIGKELWLHCEEIGGPRVLNYRYVVEP
jgi:hypothetical protein